MSVPNRYPMKSLDAWHLCSAPGCEWHVPFAETRCPHHGGKAGPAYMTDAWGNPHYQFSDGTQEPEPRVEHG